MGKGVRKEKRGLTTGRENRILIITDFWVTSYGEVFLMGQNLPGYTASAV